jgi:arylsulfatase
MKTPTPSRPNVILVLADQHHAGMMGCAGHGQAITPHFDAFAAGGMLFSQAHCQNPICTPSRVCFLSGQYAHNHGYYGLSGPAPHGLENFLGHFRANGYRTAAFGKLHLPESPRNWIAGDVDEFGDAYEDIDGDFGASEFLKGLEADGLRDFEDSWHNEKCYGEPTVPLDACPSRLPYERTLERWCVDKAIRFAGADRTKPFCVEIAFQKPHHPLLPQKEFWDMYPADLALPESFTREPSGRPPHFEDAWRHFRGFRWEFGAEGDGFEDGARRSWRGTLACVSQIDDVFGRLMAWLEASGLADNTIVIYSSDHGCYHTLKGLPEKAPGICSEDVCRIPMIWRVPGVTRAGASSDQLVESVDVAPTLAALCGLPPMESVDGSDISELLSGVDKPVRDASVTENVWSKAMRWKNWRFVHYNGRHFDGRDIGELYDIDKDPEETRNLYDDPAHRETVAACRRRLLDWITETTRSTTSMPAIRSNDGPRLMGRHTYPVCGDGRAPRSCQPPNREGLLTNYR